MENEVNSNIAEKLMSHKRGLDGVYLEPTREECFTEFEKAIAVLTVDPTERQKAQLEEQQKEITELTQLKKTNKELSDSFMPYLKMVTDMQDLLANKLLNPEEKKEFDKLTQEGISDLEEYMNNNSKPKTS